MDQAGVGGGIELDHSPLLAGGLKGVDTPLLAAGRSLFKCIGFILVSK